MKRMTESEYAAQPADYRSVWTTERWDLPNWERDRRLHLGKRTLLVEDVISGPVLLIEGMGLQIVSDNVSNSILEAF